MLRWLSFFGAVALVAAGVVFYWHGGPPATAWDGPPFGKAIALAGQQGPALADAAPVPGGPWQRVVAVTPQVVIPGARLTAIQSPQVPSMRDGQLSFLGSEINVKPTEQPPAAAFKAEMNYLVTQDDWVVLQGKAYRLLNEGEETRPNVVQVKDDKDQEKAYVPVEQDEWVTIQGKHFRPLGRREEVRPNKVRLHYAEKWFLPVDKGSRVEKDQLLALIDPSLAVDELSSKLAKLDAAEADRVASEKTRDEAHERWIRADGLWRKGAAPSRMSPPPSSATTATSTRRSARRKGSRWLPASCARPRPSSNSTKSAARSTVRSRT